MYKEKKVHDFGIIDSKNLFLFKNSKNQFCKRNNKMELESYNHMWLGWQNYILEMISFYKIFIKYYNTYLNL